MTSTWPFGEAGTANEYSPVSRLIVPRLVPRSMMLALGNGCPSVLVTRPVIVACAAAHAGSAASAHVEPSWRPKGWLGDEFRQPARGDHARDGKNRRCRGSHVLR